MPAFSIGQGDTSPAMEKTLYDEQGDPVTLTSATAVFRLINDRISQVIVDDKPLLITNPSGGVVQYNWDPGDTDEYGTCRGQIIVTYADLAVETFPNWRYIDIEILKAT